ncbi:TetR/AcrR family transcriptional regulator C-terminal domain-containing protein [Nonomuraea polychroma]|uniref:TetR/AcrR family transcriptional regulator C-terminal domain-containing protein n=1 Tax=Nonomuraea polychroma TaxID=46176 RepID=UPI001F4DAF26|nr:TetR/AcrR family transcriptional regulator C-terminal domain-containing protein [Nonomuraea polychroma]
MKRPDIPYLRIVEEIRRRITSGELAAGDKVPSTRQIVREWGVAMATASKVLGRLQEEGLARAVPGVGTVVAGAERRPPPEDLTRQRVVRAAIKIADAEGLAAVSMRRIAAELGASAMSLYRHVDGKDELIHLMADAVYGDDPPPAPAMSASPHGHPVSPQTAPAQPRSGRTQSETRAVMPGGRVQSETRAVMPGGRVQPETRAAMPGGRVQPETRAAMPGGRVQPEAGRAVSSGPRGWRAQVELVLRQQWRIHRRHPWLTQAVSLTRPQFVPNGMAHTDRLLRGLDGLGLDANTMLHAAVSLMNFVRGTAVSLEAEEQARTETGITDDEWMRAREAELGEMLASGAYPTLAKVLAQPGLDMDLDSLFEFGLRRQLDGLAVLVARARDGRRD